MGASLSEAQRKLMKQRFSLIDLYGVVYEKSYLAEILKTDFELKQLRAIHGMFNSKGILQMVCIGSLNSGMSFGEKGLNERTPRTATVICETNCHLGVIYKDDYDFILKQVSIFQQESQKRFFYETVFSRNLPQQISDRLAYDFNKYSLQLPTKSYLYTQGSVSEFVYVLETGSILISRLTKPQITEDLKLAQSKPVLHRLAVLGPGSLIGAEDVVRKDQRHYYTGVAITPCKLLRVSRECFMMHFSSEPLFAQFIKNRCRVIEANRESIMGLQTKLLRCSKENLEGAIISKAEVIDKPKTVFLRQSLRKSGPLNEIEMGEKITNLLGKVAKGSIDDPLDKITVDESDVSEFKNWKETLVNDKTFLLKQHLQRIKRIHLKNLHADDIKKAISNRTSGLKWSESMLAKCQEKAKVRQALNSSVDLNKSSIKIRQVSDGDDERKTASFMQSSKPSFYLDFNQLKNRPETSLTAGSGPSQRDIKARNTVRVSMFRKISSFRKTTDKFSKSSQDLTISSHQIQSARPALL